MRVVTESATCATSPSVARRWAQAVEKARSLRPQGGSAAGSGAGLRRSKVSRLRRRASARIGRGCGAMRRVHSAAGHQWPGHLVQRKEDAMMQAVSFARICAGLAGAVLLSARSGSQGGRQGVFVEQDGATVASPVKVKFGVDGMAVKPAGDMSAGSGHHHLIVDGKPVPRARSCRRTTRTSTLAGRNRAQARAGQAYADHAVRRRRASLLWAGPEQHDLGDGEVVLSCKAGAACWHVICAAAAIYVPCGSRPGSIPCRPARFHRPADTVHAERVRARRERLLACRCSGVCELGGSQAEKLIHTRGGSGAVGGDVIPDIRAILFGLRRPDDGHALSSVAVRLRLAA